MFAWNTEFISWFHSVCWRIRLPRCCAAISWAFVKSKYELWRTLSQCKFIIPGGNKLFRGVPFVLWMHVFQQTGSWCMFSSPSSFTLWCSGSHIFSFRVFFCSSLSRSARLCSVVFLVFIRWKQADEFLSRMSSSDPDEVYRAPLHSLAEVFNGASRLQDKRLMLPFLLEMYFSGHRLFEKVKHW